MINRQIRNLVFTMNNPEAKAPLDLTHDIDTNLNMSDRLLALARRFVHSFWFEDEENLQYIIVGVEQGEKGTWHYQGYAEFKKRLSFAGAQSIFVGCHIEHRMGTQQQAIAYCRKGGVYYESGTPKSPGTRTDLQHIKHMLESNGSIKNLIDVEGVTYNQLRSAEKILKYIEKPRDYKPQVIWLHGASGVGKTRLARELLPDAYFKTNGSGKWWPGYDGEEDVIIDELRPLSYPFTTLLGMLDRYPFHVEDKGTVRQFKGRRIIITAPKNPQMLFWNYCCENEESIKQVERRIDLIQLLEFEEEGGLLLPPHPLTQTSD